MAWPVRTSTIASIVIVVEAEGALAVSLDCEVAACHAEIIVVGGIHVERSGALAENQTCGARAIIERKIEKFENGVLVEESHRAIFKFDLGAAVVGGDHVALTDWQVRLGCFPLCLLIRERIAVGFSSKAHIALDEAKANDAGVTGVCGRRMDAHQESEERER